MSFALTEMQIVLRRLLRRFRFDLAEGHPVAPHVRVTTRPQYGMKMRVSRR
jgi:cytochrome P450